MSTKILAWARDIEILPELFWEKTSCEHPRVIEDDRVWAWDGDRYWPIAWTSTLSDHKYGSRRY